MNGFSLDPMKFVQVVNGQLPLTTPLGTRANGDGSFDTIFVRTHKVRVIRDGKVFEVREISKNKKGDRVLFNFRPSSPRA